MKSYWKQKQVFTPHSTADVEHYCVMEFEFFDTVRHTVRHHHSVPLCTWSEPDNGKVVSVTRKDTVQSFCERCRRIFVSDDRISVVEIEVPE